MAIDRTFVPAKPKTIHRMKNNKIIGLSLALACLFALPAAAQDVAKAGAGVYTLKADTLGVRIFEIKFAPGASVAMHSHPDHGVYVTEGGTLLITDKDGKSQEMVLKAGDAFFGGPESHMAKNTGSTTVRGMVFEVRRPRGDGR
jgi:quercetin dioxygenase-like cupin family protein